MQDAFCTPPGTPQVGLGEICRLICSARSFSSAHVLSDLWASVLTFPSAQEPCLTLYSLPSFHEFCMISIQVNWPMTCIPMPRMWGHQGVLGNYWRNELRQIEGTAVTQGPWAVCKERCGFWGGEGAPWLGKCRTAFVMDRVGEMALKDGRNLHLAM